MIKKIIAGLFFLTMAFSANAQYGTINAILDRLEERRGVNQNLEDVKLDDVRFVLVKDFPDHTERMYVAVNGNKANYMEVFDDKTNGTMTSNVFSGDAMRSKKNIISIRCDRLENEKIPVPVTKTFLLTQQKKILYLIDINTRERWIDEKSFGNKK